VRVSFYGAALEVTGSCHLVETGDARLLLDCGMIQGGRERHQRNREPFPFDPSGLTRVILSHAHTLIILGGSRCFERQATEAPS